LFRDYNNTYKVCCFEVTELEDLLHNILALWCLNGKLPLGRYCHLISAGQCCCVSGANLLGRASICYAVIQLLPLLSFSTIEG